MTALSQETIFCLLNLIIPNYFDITWAWKLITNLLIICFAQPWAIAPTISWFRVGTIPVPVLLTTITNLITFRPIWPGCVSTILWMHLLNVVDVVSILHPNTSEGVIRALLVILIYTTSPRTWWRAVNKMVFVSIIIVCDMGLWSWQTVTKILNSKYLQAFTLCSFCTPREIKKSKMKSRSQR